MILISDIHGCYKTLLKLLKKCPDEEIIFLGDLVDRGPRSKEVVQFAIDNKIKTTVGNHDHMMFADPKERICGNPIKEIWAINGAMDTIESYGGKLKDIPEEHIDFLRNLPYYIEYDDLLLSHTGNGKTGRNIYERVWERCIMEDSNKRLIHGHTPNKDVIIDKISINIDTGCAYKKYGTLTALQWPSMKIFSQENCE